MNKLAILFFTCSIIVGSITSGCSEKKEINTDNIKSAEKIAGIEYTETERDSLVDDLKLLVDDYAINRKIQVENSVAPKFTFDPRPINFKNSEEQLKINWNIPNDIELPENKNELAFYSIPELASLIKNKKITSTELTQFYIGRLKHFGDTLECIITLTEELALKQAQKADKEISQGIYKGPLHGIPYGVKDLFAVEGYKTTWGA